VKNLHGSNDFSRGTVQVNGFASRFQFLMYELIVLMRTRREVKVPRLIACLVMMLNRISTWFNHELPVGV
jgi:hypothetical protein